MELFSEVYGCYYSVVSRVLNKAQSGLTKSQIEELVKADGFYESSFHLLPALFLGKWNLLEERKGCYYSRLRREAKRPLTTLEKAWLKALADDPRIRLFLGDEQLEELNQALVAVQPLYQQNDFHAYDQHLDGDDFVSPEYIAVFRTVLQALQEQRQLLIGYESPGGTRTTKRYLPYRLSYSGRDDKFRLLCAVLNKKKNRLQRMTLNLARMTSAQTSEGFVENPRELAALFTEALCTEPVILEISTERNALERCMLQFASFERQTVYDREHDRYTCSLWYDVADETELLIRILSFGPTVKVLGPPNFLNQLKDRIRRQLEL